MAFNYARVADTAARLLDKFGQTVTLTRTVAGGYDPATGVTSPDVTQTAPVRAALLPYSNGDRLAAGQMIRQGDRKAYIAPDAAFQPDALTKLIEADGTVWQLESVEPLAPAGVPVLYTANATR